MTGPSAATAPASPAAATAAAPSNDPPATRYGDLLFLSGQIATAAQNSSAVTGTIEQQTNAVMEKIGTILESHRLTLANVLHVTIHLTDLGDLSAMDAAYQKHFRSNLPARTVVAVAGLPRGALVQISVQAGR